MSVEHRKKKKIWTKKFLVGTVIDRIQNEPEMKPFNVFVQVYKN